MIDPKNKVMANLPKVADIIEGRRTPPINVEIDLTNRCSLGCEWCHFAYTHSRGPLAKTKIDWTEDVGDQMDWDLIEKMLEQLASFGVKSVTWTGGGEPTLHKDFYSAILKAKDVGLKQGVYTHGAHIVQKNLAYAMVSYMDWVYISLDENNKEDHFQMKGVQGMFNSSIASIAELISKKQELKSDCKIGIGFLVREGNHHPSSLLESVQLAEDLGVDYCQFRPVILFDEDNPGTMQGIAAWAKADATSALRMLQDRVESGHFKIDVQLDLDRFDMTYHWNQQPRGYEVCWWSDVQTVITPNGKVWTCVNKRGFPGEALGDLHEDSFADIWNRHSTCLVDSTCRAMCRGHLPNLQIEKLVRLQDIEHKDFI